MEKQGTIEMIYSGLIAVCTFLFGGMSGILITLIVLIILDYITGLLCGIATKTLSSAEGAKGIIKKILTLVIVSFAHILDVNIVGSGDLLMTMTMLFYISNESISLIENCGILGLPIPQRLKSVLLQLKSDEKIAESKNKETESPENSD
ncbi:MAG: phage holin family protein [Ruminococcus sp.]|jgi:toxin secretion/phage lysis holin|nr:phage holin family protein [Ruminococcus sp.]